MVLHEIGHQAYTLTTYCMVQTTPTLCKGSVPNYENSNLIKKLSECKSTFHALTISQEAIGQ